jgi:hypothetical protein
LRRWLPLASEVQALRGPLNSAPHLTELRPGADYKTGGLFLD